MTRTNSTEARVLVSDIDGTLLDEGEETSGLKLLRATLSLMNDNVRVVYATGRTFQSTWRLVERGTLPLPDAVAPLVGTEVWLPPWSEPDQSFDQELSRNWSRDKITEVLDDLPNISLQPAYFQSRFKVSYYAEDEVDAQRVTDRLKQHEIDAKIVYSGERFLDVMPRKAGKLPAVDYILSLWVIPRDQALACGDSGNDLDMLQARELPSVAVGNSEVEVLQSPRANEIYHADYPHAAGVLQGAKAHDFWPQDR